MPRSRRSAASGSGMADHRVDAVRAAYDRGGRHDRLLTVTAVLVHQEGWNGADRIAGSEAVHPFADGLDGAGRLVPKPAEGKEGW